MTGGAGIVRFVALVSLGAILVWAGWSNAAGRTGRAHGKAIGDKKLHVEFRGSHSGVGTAQVTGNSGTMVIRGDVVDENGIRMEFRSEPLPILNGRFKGAGTVGKDSVKLSGRVDPPDRKEGIKLDRLVCTYSVAGGKHGRIVGYRDSKR